MDRMIRVHRWIWRQGYRTPTASSRLGSMETQSCWNSLEICLLTEKKIVFGQYQEIKSSQTSIPELQPPVHLSNPHDSVPSSPTPSVKHNDIPFDDFTKQTQSLYDQLWPAPTSVSAKPSTQRKRKAFMKRLLRREATVHKRHISPSTSESNTCEAAAAIASQQSKSWTAKITISRPEWSCGFRETVCLIQIKM